MDGIKEDFDIHYLYILTLVDESHIMSVISAENYYDRYVDTEGNLYLGWISDDEYDEEDIAPLRRAMEEEGITFFEQDTEWSYDYTGALALRAEDGEPYAILAVDVDITDIRALIKDRTMETSVLIIILGIIFTMTFLIWARKNITAPILLLEEGVVAFAGKSHGQRDVTLLQYEEPEIHTENEVELLSHAVTQMTEDMQGYVKDILSAEEKADQMEGLAIKDALTGIRNKTGYDREVAKLEKTLSEDPELSFGIVMIDLNYLKKMNDTYGHDKGNISIKRLSILACTVFTHSPVFRVGGDEFVVILTGWDLERIEHLIRQFNDILSQYAADESLEPWEKISASIGYTMYDPKKDTCVEDVFKRADEEMYKCKQEMHAARE
ncbi:MAG: GGDEF domain-containing protein [Lachnospiraceae bacterium]|nr:GGDEF domain-containing protein [Lachnospiraceae bacterium]